MMRSLVAISSLLLLGANATSPPDPYAIYDQARSALAAQRYPDPFRFGITIGVLDGDVAKHEHFVCESVDGEVRPLGVSDEEQRAPHDATGVNVRFVMRLAWNEHSGGPIHAWSAAGGRKEALPDFLGVPLLSPAYMFGLDDRATGPAASQNDQSGSLHSIATVVSENRAYDISLTGEETMAGIPAYHLRLAPLRSPAINRLRDLWIDETTFSVLQAKLQGNFSNAPMTEVPWTVTFATAGGLTYIKNETTLAPLRFHRDRTFDGASIAFDSIDEMTSTLPVLPNVLTQSVLREP
ncbi:MAG TPA: hypothetical protein VGK84_13695 [Candidatus Tumulicola sp.]